MIQVLKNFIFRSAYVHDQSSAKTGRLTDTDIERYGPIAALSYGPAYVDEVGILCDLNARYLGMTPVALAEWLVDDLERRGACARERHDRAAHRRVREMFG